MIYSDILDRKMRVKFRSRTERITKLLLELISLSHGTNDRRNEKKKKKNWKERDPPSRGGGLSKGSENSLSVSVALAYRNAPSEYISRERITRLHQGRRAAFKASLKTRSHRFFSLVEPSWKGNRGRFFWRRARRVLPRGKHFLLEPSIGTDTSSSAVARGGPKGG